MPNSIGALRLVHFGPFYGLCDISPFCIKAEAYMRLLGLDYDLVRGDPRKSPRGQLPVLLHEGRTIAGSAELIDYLRALCGSHIDDWLTERDQVHAYHLLRSVEEHLYFLLVYQRWALKKNFKLVSDQLFASLSPFPRLFVPHVVRGRMLQRVRAQGVGRYSSGEIDQMAYRGVEMLSRYLGEQDYFFGAKPCWVDCSMYGFVASLLIPEFTEGVCARMGEFSNLIEFESRFRARVFPDYVEN